MTSLKKHSILITEDGRGSGISEVIKGKYFKSYKESFFNIRKYDKKIQNKIINFIEYADKSSCYINYLHPEYIANMAEFFSQFKLINDNVGGNEIK